jgi:nitrate/nitrite transporter NarK
MSIEDMAIFGTLPWAFLLVTCLAWGVIADVIKAKIKHHVFWRRIVFSVALVWSGIFILLMPTASTSIEAVIYLCIAFIGFGSGWAICWALPIEYAGAQAGLVSGFMNCWGQLAGILVPLIIGYLVSDGHWDHAFWFTAGMTFVGAIVLAGTSRYNTGVKQAETAPVA